MNKAHSDAIELLKIVDSICRKEGLLYTLAGDTLITYAKMEFDQCYPAISIAMEYDSLKTVKRKLNEFCREHSGYSCHDYSNTRQFFTSDVWFVKESRVRLGEDRAEEAFYYGTHLSITPLYYAGNSQREWEETRRYFDQNILPVYFRKMLKKKPVFTYLAMTPRRIRTNRYLKHRDFDRFGEYMAKLENREIGISVFLRHYCKVFGHQSYAGGLSKENPQHIKKILLGKCRESPLCRYRMLLYQGQRPAASSVFR